MKKNKNNENNKEKEKNMGKMDNDNEKEMSEDSIEENQDNEVQSDQEEEYLVKIGQLENEVADLNDKVLRKAAEFENYKRRTENDQINLLKYSAEPFIIKLLPVVDDFERSIDHMESAKDVESIKKGVQLIYDKLLKILSEQGVTKIEAVGKPFDVDYHEAMLQRKAEDTEPHTVLDEIEKGYMYKDKVIRHSKVIVSEDLAEDSATGTDEKNDNHE